MEPSSDGNGYDATSRRVTDKAFPVASDETGKGRCPGGQPVMLDMHHGVPGISDILSDPGVVEERADDPACAVGLQIELRSSAGDAIRILRDCPVTDASPTEKNVCVSLSILEQVHDYGPGGRVWDAALVLGSHLAKTFWDKEGRMAGKLAIEIGAGMTTQDGINCCQLQCCLLTALPCM